MKMRIIFVDDQPAVLAGLRRMLRSLRDEWEMEFVESADAALAVMAESPFDVVVTDMRMPGMSGSQLLMEVMKLYPDTVRIILSGQADEVTILKAVTPAHQYLAKPCDSETIRDTVARACALRNTLNQDSLKRLVSQVTTLPSLPDVYMALMDELQSEDASVQRVAELVSKDIAMTAKLLQMVNSSFFGIPRRIESPAHAAAMLGLNVIKPLVFSAGIFSRFGSDALQGFSIDNLIEHSLNVSSLAEEITKGQNASKELTEDALLGGILHDVGQLLLAANMPQEYGKTLAVAAEKDISLVEAEQECLGANHSDVGAYLMGLWGLSPPIIEAVAFHHCPKDSSGGGFCPLTAVHVADALVSEWNGSFSLSQKPILDVDYLEHIGVADQIPKWQEIAENLYAVKD